MQSKAENMQVLSAHSKARFAENGSIADRSAQKCAPKNVHAARMYEI